MKVDKCESYWVKIFIASNKQDTERVCRKVCYDVGLCVTIEDCSYVYTGGLEEGVVVGLINYARFPDSPENIYYKAEVLAKKIMEECCQKSFTLMTPTDSVFYSRREES